MRHTLVSVAVLTVFAAPFVHAQSSNAKTPEAAPRQSCGFEFGTACGAPNSSLPRGAAAPANQDLGPRTPTIVYLNGMLNGCPVGFSAGHSNSLTQLRAGDNKPGVISQSLNVRMDNRSARDIVSAQITVHGLSPHGRLTPADAGTAATGDLSKQVALKLPVDAGQYAARDLRVYGFTSVQRIDIDSLTYADGSTWTASNQHRCSVIPNGMMLVAAAAR